MSAAGRIGSAAAAAAPAVGPRKKSAVAKRLSGTRPLAATGSAAAAAAEQNKEERRIVRARPATVDLSQCHNESLDLVRLIISLHPQHLTEARYRLNHHAMHAGNDGGDYYDRLASLLWTGRAAAKNMENFTRMNVRLGAVQTNHFPGVDVMCDKNALARKLKLMEKIYPGQYDFVPRTWVLPQEWETFRADVVAASAATAAAASSAAAAGASTTATPASPSTYIFKPSSGSQGSGILLAQRLSEIEKIYRQSCLEEGISMTVQEYISKPLLLGGLKFDFRIYVLLESLQPLRMHLYKDGLARFCTEEYVEPTGKNLKQSFMHLTNSSLNKMNTENFKIQTTADLTEEERQSLNMGLVQQSVQECKENASTASSTATSTNTASSSLPSDFLPPSISLASLGLSLHSETNSKRSIRTALAQLRAEGKAVQDKAFWKSISEIVKKTICAIWAPLLANYKLAFPTHKPSVEFPSACFHLLGFDILLDASMKPWLLELNASPSLNIESTLDLLLKKGMLEKALGLMGYLGGGGREREARRRARSETERREGSATPTQAANGQMTAQVAPAHGPGEHITDRLAISIHATTHSGSASPSPQVDSASPNPALPVSSRTGSPIVSSFNSAPPRHRGLSGPNSASTPGSGTSTPQQTTPFQAHRRVTELRDDGSIRSSPLTVPSPGSGSPLVPVIPRFHRRAASTGVPLAMGVRYITLPNGSLSVMPMDPPMRSHSDADKIAKRAAESAPTTPAQPAASDDQENVEYMEICPDEEDLSSHAITSLPGHPLLLFQHPKLLAIFDRYTSGSTTKKFTSSKFMQACIACRIVGGTGKPVPVTMVNTSGPRPLTHWPSRPDIDLLFLQHTKFDLTAGSGGSGISSQGKMLDYAGFCDIMLQIAETKYKHLIRPPATTAPTSGSNANTLSASPILTATAAAAAGGAATPSIAPMSVFDAFLHFVDNLVLPEEKGAASASSTKESIGSGSSREYPAKPTPAPAISSASPAASSAVASGPSTAASSKPKAPASTPSATRSLAVAEKPVKHEALGLERRERVSSITNSNSSAPAAPAVISHATLQAAISSLLAPKDPSTSVFSRLTGCGAPAGSPMARASTAKKRRRAKQASVGTYEAFMKARAGGGGKIV